MRVNKSIFREYDVRGIVDKDLTQDLAYHLGRALGTLMRERNLSTVSIGRDCRPSGVWLGAGVESWLFGQRHHRARRWRRAYAIPILFDGLLSHRWRCADHR